MTEIKGLLLNIRRFSFNDESSGKLIEGARLSLAVPQDSIEENHFGLKVQDLSFPYERFIAIQSQGSALIAKQVTLSCSIAPKGKTFAFIPESIKAA